MLGKKRIKIDIGHYRIQPYALMYTSVLFKKNLFLKLRYQVFFNAFFNHCAAEFIVFNYRRLTINIMVNV